MGNEQNYLKDELMDLGAASVETQGGDEIGLDFQGLRKPVGISED